MICNLCGFKLYLIYFWYELWCIDEKYVYNWNNYSKEDNNSFKNKKLIYFKLEWFKMLKYNEMSCYDWCLYFYIIVF